MSKIKIFPVEPDGTPIFSYLDCPFRIIKGKTLSHTIETSEDGLRQFPRYIVELKDEKTGITFRETQWGIFLTVEEAIESWEEMSNLFFNS